MNNLKTVQCPKCKSENVKHLEDKLFECLSCGTSFYVDTNQTTIKHKHFYTDKKSHSFTGSGSRRSIYILKIAVAFFLLIFISISFLISTKDSNGTDLSRDNRKKDFTFNISSSAAFTDKAKNLQIFMIGTLRSADQKNNQHKDKIYWAVYDAVKGTYEQIEPLNVTHTREISFNGIECFRFDDGNIYTVIGKNMLYKYDASTKTIRYLNDEILTNTEGLESGIASIEDTRNAYAAFEITSNNDKKIMYFPGSKVSISDFFSYRLKDHSYTGDKPTVFFFPTYNSPPSYLVRYTAMYSAGYPICFNPHIISKFDKDKNFISADFDTYWLKSSRMTEMEVLNTDHSVYRMTMLDYRDGVVAIGVKTNNTSTEKFKIQWLDYDGKIQWSANAEDSYLYAFSGIINKDHGLLYGNDNKYFMYSNTGKLLKKLELDKLSFDLE